jgi:hypothetical protein
MAAGEEMVKVPAVPHMAVAVAGDRTVARMEVRTLVPPAVLVAAREEVMVVRSNHLAAGVVIQLSGRRPRMEPLQGQAAAAEVAEVHVVSARMVAAAAAAMAAAAADRAPMVAAPTVCRRAPAAKESS